MSKPEKYLSMNELAVKALKKHFKLPRGAEEDSNIIMPETSPGGISRWSYHDKGSDRTVLAEVYDFAVVFEDAHFRQKKYYRDVYNEKKKEVENTDNFIGAQEENGLGCLLTYR